MTPPPDASPDPTGKTVADGCAELLRSLPATLNGPNGPLPRRAAVQADRVTAWGSPPVTLECGVAPGVLTGEVFTVGPNDGKQLTFEVDDVGTATAFTTGGRDPDVRITVPGDYDAVLLVDLVRALTS